MREEARNVEQGLFWQSRFDSDYIEREAIATRSQSVCLSLCLEIRFESGFRTRPTLDPPNGDGRRGGARRDRARGRRRKWSKKRDGTTAHGAADVARSLRLATEERAATRTNLNRPRLK